MSIQESLNADAKKKYYSQSVQHNPRQFKIKGAVLVFRLSYKCDRVTCIIIPFISPLFFFLAVMLTRTQVIL